MRFLQGVATDTLQSELIALDKIVSLKNEGDSIKILVGSGLYWRFIPESVQIVALTDEELLGELTHE